MEAPREVMLIAGHDARRTLRSAKGIALLTLFVGSFLLAGVGFVLASERAEAQLAAEAPEGSDPAELAAQAKAQLFRSFAGEDPKLAQSLARTPAVVLFFFASALLFLPGLVVLMSYDTIAGEVQGRTARYTLLRASRLSFVLGKFAGQAALLAFFTLAVSVVLLVFAAIRIPGFELGVGVVSLLRYWLLSIVYGLTFVSLSLLASSLTELPLLALLYAFGGLFALGVIWALGLSQSLSFVHLLSPFSHWSAFFQPDPLRLLGGIAANLVFAAVFLATAVAVVEVSDL